MKKVGNKVVVVGTGSVGISYAYSMLNQALCDDLVLIDLNRKRAEGEARDFRHGMPYAASPARIYVGDYGDCSDADIVCICAGLPQRPGETRLDLIDNNLRDSARFRSCLGNEFNVAPWSVDAMMIGEHGDSVIAVWSTANISGMSVKKILGQEEGGKARMEKIYSNVRNAAYEVIEAKGSTSHGIGMGLSRISNAILHNQGVVLPVSSLLEGEFGQENVYIGVPTVVNRQGAVRIINLDLSDDEAEQFARSAELLKSYQRKVDDFMAAR